MISKRILITGGTGSIGQEVARHLSGNQITIFSRSEKDQVIMKSQFANCEFIIGDIRDKSEVCKAVKHKDYVFHFAAMKHIDICEKHPQEAVKTNVLGTLNLINACTFSKAKLVNMSSDKAINPASVYGRSKSLGEAMAQQAGFCSIRSGNVLWSSGSVLPIWEKQIAESNEIRITSEHMTRFFIHPFELAEFIISKADDTGIFTVPMRSFKLIEIAEEFIRRVGNKYTEIVVTGLRQGERLHEFRDENTSSEEVCHDMNYIFQEDL